MPIRGADEQAVSPCICHSDELRKQGRSLRSAPLRHFSHVGKRGLEGFHPAGPKSRTWSLQAKQRKGIEVEVVDVEPDRAMELLFGSDEEYWEAVLLTDGEGDSTSEFDSGLVDAREAAETAAAAE